MVFVTVGTHEQSFDRLINYIDTLKEKGIISDDVFIQTGYSNYEPKYCNYKKFLSYDEMKEKISNSKIVITHGGPSSFIEPLALGIVPIVVPRKKEYNEHVNNHQVDFVEEVKNRMKNIIVANTLEEVEDAIVNYDKITKNMKDVVKSNNLNFCAKLEKIINEL